MVKHTEHGDRPVTSVACSLCPALLHREADPVTDTWVWADDAGQRSGADPDVAHLQPDPYAHLKALGARCVTGSGRRRRVDHAAAAEYTMLKVRLETRGTFHEHSPAELPAWDGPPPPEHCGWPSGWRCRQCGAALALERAA